MNEPYEGDPRAYCAIARVDDDDPINILERDGKVLGMAVDCTIVDGVFVGCRVAAKLCAPLGQATPNLPGPGDYIVLMLPHGHLDGPILATHAMPGGIAKPMPPAVAGIDVSNVETLSKVQLTAPPKGVGLRYYLRGAPFVIRLKGKQDGFAGEFYLEADDGTFVRLLWNPATQSFAVKVRDAKGAYFQVGDGKVSMAAEDQETCIALTPGRIDINAKTVAVNGEGGVDIKGGFIGLNLPTLPLPPTPDTASALAVVDPATLPAPKPAATIWVGKQS